MRPKLPPLDHPLAALFQRAAASLTASLSVPSMHFYHGTVRNFLTYLGTQHAPVHFLPQLRRDPHILDWFTLLRSHQPPFAKVTHAQHIIRLRRILQELAWTHHIPELLHLIRSDDIPRPDHYLPRPLTAEQDRLIQQELLRRDDRDSNVFLLLRRTGMRIGECADLSWDCLRCIDQDLWALRVPLGKLRTERLIPVDSFVCQLVHRLRRLRSPDRRPGDGFLLARRRGRDPLIRELRASLCEIVAALGITTHIVPHQFRHSFGTEMLRAGMSLPAVMKMLGHTNPNMTLRYLQVSALDLQREFHFARSQPRHIVPTPRVPTSLTSPKADLPSLLDSLQITQHVLEMFRRTLPDGRPRHLLGRLANRLTKIASEARKLGCP
jgi:integrase